METTYLKRTIICFIGVLFIGLGIVLFRVSEIGVSPYAAANLSVGVNYLKMSLGTFQLLVSFLMFIVVLLLGRKYINIGTIINLVLLGYVIDFFTYIHNYLFNFEFNLVLKIIYLLIGILVFTFGVSLYMAPKLGTAPYDALPFIIADKSRIKYKYAVIMVDITSVSIAIAFGGLSAGYIGIGTIVVACVTGPLIVFWNDLITYQIVWKKKQAEVEALLQKA